MSKEENNQVTGIKKRCINSAIDSKTNSTICQDKIIIPTVVVSYPDQSVFARKVDGWKKAMSISEKNLFDEQDPDPKVLRHMSLPPKDNFIS